MVPGFAEVNVAEDVCLGSSDGIICFACDIGELRPIHTEILHNENCSSWRWRSAFLRSHLDRFDAQKNWPMSCFLTSSRCGSCGSRGCGLVQKDLGYCTQYVLPHTCGGWGKGHTYTTYAQENSDLFGKRSINSHFPNLNMTLDQWDTSDWVSPRDTKGWG